MYLVDSNVVSELRKVRKGTADKRVMAWEQSVSASELYLSVITILELEVGVQLMGRRDHIQGSIPRRWLEKQVVPAFQGRILPVDFDVTRRCAGLHVPNPRPELDALIAATALVHGMTLVIRNVSGLQRMGVRLLNSWEAQSA